MSDLGFLFTQQGTIAGPAVWFRHRAIVIFDESKNAILQVIQRTERSIAGELPPQRSKPDFNLVEPAAMLRGVHEVNPMTLVGQELSTRWQ